MRLISGHFRAKPETKARFFGFHPPAAAMKPSPASGAEPLVLILPGRAPARCGNGRRCLRAAASVWAPGGLGPDPHLSGSGCPPAPSRAGGLLGWYPAGGPGGLTRWVGAGAACTSLLAAGGAAPAARGSEQSTEVCLSVRRGF